VLIEKIKACGSDAELLDELSQIKCWTYGKVCFVCVVLRINLFMSLCISSTNCSSHWSFLCHLHIMSLLSFDDQFLMWIISFK